MANDKIKLWTLAMYFIRCNTVHVESMLRKKIHVMRKAKQKREKKKKESIEMWFKEMETWTSRVMFYRSMLNCVNALEGHIPPAESAALMVAEEKPHPDSCKALKKKKTLTNIVNTIMCKTLSSSSARQTIL